MSKYTKTNWQNNDAPALNATNLNHLEDGVVANSENIEQLLGSMKFMGTTATLPTSDLTVGDVYEATESNLVANNKIGDLLVYVDENTWHVIPSGNETLGTVTRVTAGDGISISGGVITDSGTISVEPSTYLANSNRSGFLHKDDKAKIDRLKLVALSGDWNDLDVKPNIPTLVQNIDTEVTPETENRTVSEKAIILALRGKANEAHSHTIEQISELSEVLEDDVAAKNHNHGYIHNNGRLYKTSVMQEHQNAFLRTDNTGVIYGTETIPSSVIDGTTFQGQASTIDIELHAQKLSRIENILTPTDESTMMDKAATEDHTHEILTSDERGGFVPPIPADSDTQSYSLHSDGWRPLPEDFVNYIYPVGSYYETYLPPYPGEHGEGGRDPVSKKDLTEEMVKTLGLKWFNPNYAWGGLWKLETGGLVHVSGTLYGQTASEPLVGTGSEPVAGGYAVDAATQENAKDPTLHGKVGGDGGEPVVLLRNENCGIPKHNHGFNATFGVRQGISTSSGNKYATVFKGTNTTVEQGSDSTIAAMVGNVTTIQSNAKAGVTSNADKKREKVTITGGVKNSEVINPTAPHNNMQPYYNVYRWVRIEQDGDQSIPLDPQSINVACLNLEKYYCEPDPDWTSRDVVKVESQDTDDPAVLGSVQFSVARVNGEDVGQYDIIVGGESPQQGYVIHYIPGVFTIKKSNIAIGQVTEKGDSYFKLQETTATGTNLITYPYVSSTFMEMIEVGDAIVVVSKDGGPDDSQIIIRIDPYEDGYQFNDENFVTTNGGV